MLYVANGFIPFEPGDVFIIGSNIPHLMRAEERISNPPNVDAISLFFGPSSFGHHFFNTPELLDVNALLQKSKRGIKFNRPNSKEIGQIIEKAFEHRNFDLLISLLQVLNKISGCYDNKMMRWFELSMLSGLYQAHFIFLF